MFIRPVVRYGASLTVVAIRPVTVSPGAMAVRVTTAPVDCALVESVNDTTAAEAHTGGALIGIDCIDPERPASCSAAADSEKVDGLTTE